MFEVGLPHYLALAATLFVLGLFGLLLNRRNLLRALLSIELMLLSANINFAAFARHLDDVTGHVFVLFSFAIAAAESAIGLALFIVYFKTHHTLTIENPNLKR